MMLWMNSRGTINGNTRKMEEQTKVGVFEKEK